MIVVHNSTPFDVYGGRETPFGNYTAFGASRAEILRNHWLSLSQTTLALAKAELLGKRVGCWCTPKQCHLENIAHHLMGEVKRPIKNTVFGLVVSKTLTQQDFPPGLVIVYNEWESSDFVKDSQLIPVFWDGVRVPGHKGVLVI